MRFTLSPLLFVPVTIPRTYVCVVVWLCVCVFVCPCACACVQVCYTLMCVLVGLADLSNVLKNGTPLFVCCLPRPTTWQRPVGTERNPGHLVPAPAL